MDKDLYTLKEIANYLKVSEKTIYNLIKAGKIRYRKVGRQYRFDKSSLDVENVAHAASVDPESAQKVGRSAGKRSKQPAFIEDLIAIKNVLQKRLLFMAYLTRACEAYGVKPIIVGGNAVEFYSYGDYATSDIDVISPSDVLDKVLSDWEFRKEGRYWYRDDLEIAIESPGLILAGDQARISRILIQGMSVYIIGVEDLIIDRLNAYVHSKSEEDGHWTKELILLNRDNIDRRYLEERAEEEKTSTALRRLIKES